MFVATSSCCEQSRFWCTSMCAGREAACAARPGWSPGDGGSWYSTIICGCDRSSLDTTWLFSTLVEQMSSHSQGKENQWHSQSKAIVKVEYVLSAPCAGTWREISPGHMCCQLCSFDCLNILWVIFTSGCSITGDHSRSSIQPGVLLLAAETFLEQNHCV